MTPAGGSCKVTAGTKEPKKQSSEKEEEVDKYDRRSHL